MVSEKNKRPIFKQCTSCGFQWRSRDAFLWDPTTVIVGYQARFKELMTGIFLFNHSCGTTIAIQAVEFKDLYSGPIFQRRATDTEECPGYCLVKNELRSCPVQCECAFCSGDYPGDQDISQLIEPIDKGCVLLDPVGVV